MQLNIKISQFSQQTRSAVRSSVWAFIACASWLTAALVPTAAHACACCLNGPGFGVTTGLQESYFSHHVDTITAVQSVPAFASFALYGEAAAGGFRLNRPKISIKLETPAPTRAPAWLLTLTETVNNKRQTVVLRFTAAHA